jgi:hypothetical protein
MYFGGYRPSVRKRYATTRGLGKIGRRAVVNQRVSRLLTDVVSVDRSTLPA